MPVQPEMGFLLWINQMRAAGKRWCIGAWCLCHVPEAQFTHMGTFELDGTMCQISTEPLMPLDCHLQVAQQQGAQVHGSCAMCWRPSICDTWVGW